jgi:hypothetical protein
MITREFLQANHAALVDAIRAEGAAQAAEQATTQAIATERARIAAVLGAAKPGHEALTARALTEGMSAEQYAFAVLTAERADREAAAKAHRDDAPDPVKDAPPPQGDGKTLTLAQFNALSPQDRMAQSKAGVKVVD